MEKWNAYTRDGNLTDVILIKDEPIPTELYHMVCEVLVKHIDGCILCMKRAMNKKVYAGRYEATAGGSALIGEDKMQCVKRELEEETGITCDTFDEIGCHINDRSHTIFYSFVCEVDIDKDKVRLQIGETEDYRWMPEAEFKDFLLSDSVIESQKQRFLSYYEKMKYIE